MTIAVLCHTALRDCIWQLHSCTRFQDTVDSHVTKHVAGMILDHYIIMPRHVAISIMTATKHHHATSFKVCLATEQFDCSTIVCAEDICSFYRASSG